MPLSPGSRLGPYEVLSPLGAGGMGEVYRARDPRLGREVAIKVLPDGFSADPERLRRFELEARAAGALSHPNLLAVFDTGQHEGAPFVVFELLEGATLRARLGGGALPPPKALDYAIQMARGLAAAHEKGIVHRDLKPDNLFLTREGPLKILDFGLAKLRPPFDPGDVNAQTRTASVNTEAHTILGTVGYMSPEQVRRFPADHRSDIFSFGSVLYEMLSGSRPFRGGSEPETLTAILNEDPPPLTEATGKVPVALERIVRHCLEKRPEDRFQSARDLVFALEAVTQADTAGAAGWPPRRGRRMRLAMVAGVVGLGLLAVGGLWFIALGTAGWVFQPMPPGPLSRFEAPAPDGVTPYDDVSVSPDGRKLVFASSGRDGLWVRDFDAVEWRRLAATEGAWTPFWSPDSRYVGFTVDNKVKKIDTAGSPPETVASLPNTAQGSGTWNRNGDIVLGTWGGGSGGPLWRVSKAGGTATAVTQVDVSKGEFFHTWPTFLPDGKHFLYFRSGPPDVEGMYVGSLDVDAGAQSRQRILATNVPALYANGCVFLARAGTLLAQPFDAGRRELRGEPVPVAKDVLITWYSTGVFSVSDKGVLAYRTAPASPTLQLTWLDRQGKPLGTFGAPGTDTDVELSPDGKRGVVRDSPSGFPGDLWTLDFASGRRTRLTFHKKAYSPGVWSPDGARIAYSAGDLGDTLYEKAASGLGDEQLLLEESGLRHYPTSWSRDGRFLLYHTENAPGTGYDLWALSLHDRRPHLMLGEACNEWAGVFSPDMRWVAYVSLETGASEVYVRPFRVSGEAGQPSLGEGKWQVSKDHGNWPRWRVGGEILFNKIPDGAAVFAVPVQTTRTSFESGVPRLLPFPPSVARNSTPQPTLDGQRFLVEESHSQRSARTSISVVLNWPALLKE